MTVVVVSQFIQISVTKISMYVAVGMLNVSICR